MDTFLMPIRTHRKAREQGLKAKSAEELYQTAKGAYAMISTEFVVFIDALDGLYQSNYFRSLPEFKNASFDQFLRCSGWNMTEGSFIRARRAVFGYPEETQKLGPGIVIDVVEKCTEPKKALKLIEDGIAASKKPVDLPMLKADAIEKYHKVKPKPAKLKVPKVVIPELVRLREENIQLRKELKAKDRQIERLKATAKRYKDEAERFKKEISVK